MVLNTAAIINFRRHKCNYRMEDRQIPQADWIRNSYIRFFGQTGNRISENRPRGGIYDGGL